VTVAPYTAAPRAAAAFTPASELDQLAAALYGAVLNGTPRRAAPMTAAGEAKYRDLPGHSFAVEDYAGHLGAPGAVARTWATTLDHKSEARAGCRDYDEATEAEILAALDAAAAAGLVAFAILMPGAEGEHHGGHIWPLYRRPAPVADICHQLAAVLPAGKGEIYPSGSPIRLPFGYHRRKQTRGVLLLQDGRRFALDTPAELLAGIRAVLALPRNAPPPPAPAGSRRADGARVSVAYDPALWEGVSPERGAALMASSRYKALFGNPRRQLFKLQAGHRVTTYRDGSPDDSDSAQVAVLVNNLLTVGRSTDGKGTIVPGLGAPPEAEIRAVALHWRERLRPGCSLDKYRWQVDYEIARYRPEGYAPAATEHIPGAKAATPGELQPARHRGRPAGARAAQVERLGAYLAERVGERVTRPQLAEILGVKIRAVACYLATLRTSEAWEVAIRAAGRGGLVVEKCARKSAPESVQTPAPKEATEGAVTPNCDAAPALGSTPAPPCPLRPAPAAAGDAPALDTADLLALIDAGRIAIRRGLDPRTGEQGDTGRSRASRELVWCYVAQHAPDVARATFDAAWAEGQDIFRTFDRWLAGEPEPGELYAELRKLQAGIDRAREPAPMPWAELPDDRRRKLVDRARALAPQAVEALVLRARGEAPPAPLGDAEALAVAQERYARRIAAHKRDCQQLKRREILRDKLRRALRYRGLPLEAPPATIGKRAKAPSRDDVRRAEAEQQAECLEALDRLRARARAEAPPATRRPRVELPRAVNSTRDSTDASPPALDLAAARARMVERIRRGESLILPAQEASFAD
jgi:hypothetical protein